MFESYKLFLQVFCQPIFTTVENWCCHKWPESGFVTKRHPITFPSCGVCYVNMFRVIWRTVYVILTAVIAMLFPFFNSVIGLLGAIAFWPLTVYFPVEMYISRAKIRKFSITWMWLQVLSWTCFIVTLLAAAGSIQGLVKDLQTYKPFSSASQSYHTFYCFIFPFSKENDQSKHFMQWFQSLYIKTLGSCRETIIRDYIYY